MPRFAALLVIASVLMLSACASSGGGGSSPSPSPSPAPPPPPPPPPATNTDLINLFESQDFTNDGASSTTQLNLADGGKVQTASSAAGGLTVHYDAVAHSYTISTAGRSQTFAQADLQPSTPDAWPAYKKTQAGATNFLTLIRANPFNGDSLTYVALGFWQRNQTSNSVQSTTYDAFTYGIPTPASATPRTGAANYEVGIFGVLTTPGAAPWSVEGDGTLNVDFASGAFSTTIPGTVSNLVDGSGASGVGIDFQAHGRLSSSDGGFSGTAGFEYSDYTVVGSLSGRFYGPTGKEVGATFSLSNPAGAAMTGSFVGKKAGDSLTQNFSLTQLAVDEHMRGLGADIIWRTGEIRYRGMTDAQVTLNTTGVLGITPGNNTAPFDNFGEVNQVASVAPGFNSYQESLADLTINVDSYKLGSGNSELALTYSSFEHWRQAGPPGSDSYEVYYSTGMTTPGLFVTGRTGTGRYTGVAYGVAINGGQSARYDLKGTSQFDVDFSRQTLSASFSLTGVRQGDGASRDFGAFASTGTFHSAGATTPITQSGQTVGSLQTRFFGPNAEEIGGPFSIGLDPGTDPTAIAGVAAAKRN